MSTNITDLTLKQKIGQLFFIGLPGVELDPKTEELLNDIEPGGICLFSRNVREAGQVRRLLDDVVERSLINPLLSVDQEGGLVDRLRRVMTPMPSASAISKNGGIEDAGQLAQITAQVIRRLGFNMNFAPVVDVVDEAREGFSNGLQSRAFGRSKEDVIEFAGRYLHSLQENGCLGCLKHFPGLGPIQVDAHEELPSVRVGRDELCGTDLVPYERLFKSNEVHAVMVGHALYPNLGLQEEDANGKLLPSSLSFNIITKLLREELGFKGLVLTDDLEMGAILRNFGIEEACKLAVKAGQDMLLICADVDAMRRGYEAVLEAVRKGEISEARIEESLQRILAIKSLIEPPLPFDRDVLAGFSAEVAELNKRVDYSYGG